jgi:hypothetical protein
MEEQAEVKEPTEVKPDGEVQAETKTETQAKTPEEMNDAEFRKAVMDTLATIGDSHLKLAKKLTGFINQWELRQKAGKF